MASLSDIPPQMPCQALHPGRLGKRRQRIVLFLTMIGLASFVSPLIRTDTQVLGRTRWSPLQIAVELHKGTLPGCYLKDHELCDDPGEKIVELAFNAVFGAGTAYAMLVAIAASALLFPWSKFVSGASVIGAIATAVVQRRGNDSDLQYFICSGTSVCHVHNGAFVLVLLLVFGLLIWIAATKQLDY